MISQASGSFPSGDYPPFPGAVRLAKAADLSRMADVSVLGFKDSEIFRFERPHYHEFPEDAVASFACIYRAHLLDPRMVVVVVEDVRRPDELTSLPAAGEKEYGTTTPENVVVGVASWAFPEGSKRQGNFIVPDVGRLDPSPDRDLSHRRLELFNRITEETQAKYLSGATVCEKLVVHPSYQRRGHATSMLRWSLSLADYDGVDQGVMPSHMGEPLYLSLGFKVIGEMHVPDDGVVEGFKQRVIRYVARQ